MDTGSIVSELRQTFESGKTRPIAYRKEQLRNLWHLVVVRPFKLKHTKAVYSPILRYYPKDNRDRFAEAIFKDVGKPPVQVEAFEVLTVANDIVHMLQNLDDWLKDESVETLPSFENWSPIIRKRPKGVVLILGTWNYPLTLTLLPFSGLIAAGNAGILRPSEFAPHTGDLIAELFPNYLDPSSFRCVLGGREAAESLLKHPYGHILFTGGLTVGKEVMKAAAQNITPVTLELGGRNAAIVSNKANVRMAAKRILWAKAAAAGQTCFAPNVAIVHDAVYDEFLDALKDYYAEFYKGKPKHAAVGNIVNANEFSRARSLFTSTKGKVLLGGTLDEKTRFIEPTIVTDVNEDDAILQSEMFGPILPILRATDIIHAQALVRSIAPESLGLYIFTEDMEEANSVVNTLPNGSACINDLMGQVAPPSMPFGGFGKSGFGSYRGKASIDTFSHKQSIVSVPTVPEFEQMLEWRYPYADQAKTVEYIRANMLAPLPPQ
ncbi:succinate semialdehyde dehydrogenase, putative [Talaromyces stipitatus ATCC 10500]|uniref:Aldehyde dehydrogenase n=1 Tax=Talaromyces stipitatus (strain ATCC 10500 / CBS 375.48 / QM 6759 / NRRL 1006) TaxID=441959 RepID=B8MCE4_TALSN|nr:succinate semialdehyde dehydrogenase, putative [Talaromyces stipitatus ATCC 10500]EED18760.1 succinate semialdehyde dehydrogenase, putative [Talaromyces stipitatus ATCC 10500]